MATQTNQENRELKWLEAKETNPSLLYVRELRGMNVNEEVTHAPQLDSLPQAQPICMVQPQIQKTLITFHPPYIRVPQHQLALFYLSQVWN